MHSRVLEVEGGVGHLEQRRDEVRLHEIAGMGPQPRSYIAYTGQVIESMHPLSIVECKYQTAGGSEK